MKAHKISRDEQFKRTTSFFSFELMVDAQRIDCRSSFPAVFFGSMEWNDGFTVKCLPRVDFGGNVQTSRSLHVFHAPRDYLITKTMR